MDTDPRAKAGAWFDYNKNIDILAGTRNNVAVMILF